MGKYEKPIIMESADLAEGVFFASGDSGNTISVAISMDEQGGFSIVHVIFTNTGSQPFNLNKFVLTFNKDIAFITPPAAYNVSASCDGKVITGIPVNSVIDANDSYTFIAHLNQCGLVVDSYQINP